MTSHTHDDPRLVAAAERRMQTWSRIQEIEDHAAQARQGKPPTACAVKYVAVSRLAGSGGSEVATRLGEVLGWPVYDRNLLDSIAERFREPRSMLDAVDETPSNWVFDVLGTWIDPKIVSHEKYLAHVRRTIRFLARRGRAVFVGRGAQFLLPRDQTLAVRIVASERYRQERMMTADHLDADQARRWVRETDRERHAFIQRFFHHDVNDPCLYDLVINIERLGLICTVDQIVRAACCKKAE